MDCLMPRSIRYFQRCGPEVAETKGLEGVERGSVKSNFGI